MKCNSSKFLISILIYIYSISITNSSNLNLHSNSILGSYKNKIFSIKICFSKNFSLIRNTINCKRIDYDQFLSLKFNRFKRKKLLIKIEIDNSISNDLICNKLVGLKKKIPLLNRIKYKYKERNKGKLCETKMINNNFHIFSQLKNLRSIVQNLEKKYGIFFDKMLQFNSLDKINLYYFYYFIKGIDFEIINFFDFTIVNLKKNNNYLLNISKFKYFKYKIPMKKIYKNRIINKWAFTHENLLYKHRMNKNRIKNIRLKYFKNNSKRNILKYLYQDYFSKKDHYQVFYFKKLIDVNFRRNSIILNFPWLKIFLKNGYMKNKTKINKGFKSLIDKNYLKRFIKNNSLKFLEYKSNYIGLNSDERKLQKSFVNYDSIYLQKQQNYKNRSDYLEKILNEKVPASSGNLNKGIFKKANFELYKDKNNFIYKPESL